MAKQLTRDPRFADGKLLDLENGLVARRIYSDQEIYDQEMERVFHHTWLFLGHDSMLPRPGDFITNSMGDDPVIVWRDPRGQVHAFLNNCTHRGNKLCLYDRGRAASFSCSYHGWTFSSEGKLVGVPFLDEAYYGQLEVDCWSLIEVPRIESLGGLLFGNWAQDAPPLTEYLGDVCWYFDTLFGGDIGRLEAIPGCQRYAIVGNWKLFCDNFAGDGYHVPTSHASAFQVDIGRRNYRDRRGQRFMVHLAPAHGFGGLTLGDDGYQDDLAKAQQLGPESVEWVRERYRRLQEHQKDRPAKLAGWTWGQWFPNLNLQAFDSALRGRLFILCQPKGPDGSEILQWCLVEKEAPRAIKELAARMATRGQSGTGLIGVDDGENFERITENMRTVANRDITSNYVMTLDLEGRWPGQESWPVQGLPGLIGPHMWETSQRHFYRYWAQLMGVGD